MEVGTKKRGHEIGKRENRYFIYQACSECGKFRWVILCNGKPVNTNCRLCGIALRKATGKYGGANSVNWKGGYYKDKKGYVRIYVKQDDPLFPMCRTSHGLVGGYISEHRYIMAQHLGRCLERKELVHHLNGIKSDNRIENLGLVSPTNHEHHTFIVLLQKRIRNLEANESQQRLDLGQPRFK